MIRVVASDGVLTGHDESDSPFTIYNPEGTTTGTGLPIDPTLLLIVGAIILVIIVIVVILSRRGKGKK